MKTSRSLLLIFVLVAAGSTFLSLRSRRSLLTEIVFEGKTKPPEAGPLCPWREPEADLKAFFPKATRYQIETRILSGLRTELGQRLGRSLTGDENALSLYRVFEGDARVGTVMTRRVKGDYGAIELVLATNPAGQVCGMRLQRLREPESIANALTNPGWQHSFMGLTCESAWQVGDDITDVPTEAQTSARAVVEGARSVLILLAAADQSQSQSMVAKQHH